MEPLKTGLETMESKTPRSKHLENIQQYCTPIKIPPSPFMKSLGFGTGVNVYQLERSPVLGHPRSPWALKRISKRAQSGDVAQGQVFNVRIQKEAEILRKLIHPNIVGFRGISKTTDGVDSLALECCKTSLGAILEERHEDSLGALPAKDTLKMVSDIASALDYLHMQAKLLHGDLKSMNVLVKGEFDICKLCDFGVSLPIGENGLIDFSKNPNLRYVGTNLWSAPEIMDDADIIDCKVDIFSFGLVIYETIALVPPHSIFTDEAKDQATDVINLDSSTDNTMDTSSVLENTVDTTSFAERIEQACGTRPALPQAFELSEDYNRVVELFYCCTNELAEDRPNAKTIWQSLSQPLSLPPKVDK